jgi:hypothetical protein
MSERIGATKRRSMPIWAYAELHSARICDSAAIDSLPSVLLTAIDLAMPWIDSILLTTTFFHSTLKCDDIAHSVPKRICKHEVSKLSKSLLTSIPRSPPGDVVDHRQAASKK